MAKRQNKSAYLYQISMREALVTFNLEKLKKWMQKYNKPLYRIFKSMPEEVQMGAMCKMICNRTDLLGSDVHRKAITWLKEHNMKGRLFSIYLTTIGKESFTLNDVTSISKEEGNLKIISARVEIKIPLDDIDYLSVSFNK